MKVLQINAALEYGSTGRNAIELSDFLEKNGHESIIAYSMCIKPTLNSYRINSAIDVKMHGLLSRLTGLQGYFSYFATKKLIKFMKKEKFDIVNLGNLHGNFINIPMLFSYLIKTQTATVITLHDCFLYTGRCTHYTKDNCFLWKSGCENCPRLKKDNVSWFFDRSKQVFNMKKNSYEKMKKLAVIGVSKWITDEAKLSVLKNAQYIECIYNWVDTDIFKPKENNIKRKFNLEGKFVILGVASSWGTDKGIDGFYELSEKILKERENYQIVLVGNNTSKKKIKNITYIEETHDVMELSEIYNMADVFLNLSTEESFGKVTAEALSCGVPVIVPDTTANPELVKDGCGYVFEKFDMEKIINYTDEIHKKGKEFYIRNTRDFAKENFSKNDNLKKYLALFEKIIKGKN